MLLPFLNQPAQPLFPALLQDATSLWLFFALYFLVRYRRVQARRSVGDPISIAHVCGFLAIPLIFLPSTHLLRLGTHFHTSRAVALLGFAMVTAGLAFSAWSRDVLGRNWSGRIIIQDSHQLITAGPYAYLRHPLYTGILFAAAGTVLIVADYAAILGFLFAVARFLQKARREERLLETEFGPVYQRYKASTGALLPRIAHV